MKATACIQWYKRYSSYHEYQEAGDGNRIKGHTYGSGSGSKTKKNDDPAGR